jgi:SAM-dependent methyltransferase
MEFRLHLESSERCDAWNACKPRCPHVARPSLPSGGTPAREILAASRSCSAGRVGCRLDRVRGSPDWDRVPGADCLDLADAIARAARDLSDSMPPPRGMPFFGLDSLENDPYVLDRFAEHGIFRKYQHTLQLGGGLGGEARYWALRLGCRVLSVDPHPGLAAAATRLSARARLGSKTRFQTGALHALPLRERQFTHVWSITDLGGLDDPLPALREAHRVLRPGGILCLRTEAGREGSDRWSAALLAAGFVAIRRQTVLPVETGLFLLFAETRLRLLLAETRTNASPLPGLHDQICRLRRRRKSITRLLSAERPA